MIETERIPLRRHDASTIVVATSKSGLELRNNEYDYWVECSFNGQRYVSESKYLNLTLGDLRETLQKPITIFQVTGKDRQEQITRYDLSRESRELLVAGWRHALIRDSRFFLSCIAKVTAVTAAALTAVALDGEIGAALPLLFVIAGAAAAISRYVNTTNELPQGAQLLDKVLEK